MINGKYNILLNILDQLRKEAPRENKRYYPLESDVDAVNKARARAFIHLFLKVKFGLLDFKEREGFVTDDSQDGGIDAYYIDDDSKRVFFIQSKFRTTEANFSNKEILLSDLLHMEVDRISKGEETDVQGNPYNGKIHRLLHKIREIPDIGRWKYEVIILANLNSGVTHQQLRRLTGGFDASVFNHERTYIELVFPVVQGTYYHPNELKIAINLSNTSSASSRITYKVTTKTKDCDITVLFVPTVEIAKAMYKYRNSILKYNPRSYLELANNDVNKDIARTITELQTNEFALYNNGITMLSFGTYFNEQIGQRDKAQLIITQPQIINGGQTAFTLSRLYEGQAAKGDPEGVFINKEVLLKVITLHPDTTTGDNSYLALIEAISKATNQQSPVDEADRRSNDQIQGELQRAIYEKYGYFYERKRGEYADGIRAGYISRSQIIDRELFLRLCKCCDLEPATARRTSRKLLFESQSFNRTLNDARRFSEYFFAYRCYETLTVIERRFANDKNNKLGIVNYGNGLVYGKYAIVSACRMQYQGEQSIAAVENIVNEVLEKWISFENHATALPSNEAHFRTFFDEETGVQKQEQRFDNYYKGSTLNSDLSAFFQRS